MPKILGALQVTTSLLYLCFLAVNLCQSYTFVLMALHNWCSVASFVTTVKNAVIDDLWFVFRKYKEFVTRF
jgi:glycogen synthase